MTDIIIWKEVPVRKKRQKPIVELTTDYKRVRNETIGFDETNDCSVKAMAILLEIPYAKAHEHFRHVGRKSRNGANNMTTILAYSLAGYKLVSVPLEKVRHPRQKTVTSYHPDKYPDIWEEFVDSKLLLHSVTHAMAFDGGFVHCWANGRSLRIINIWELEKE